MADKRTERRCRRRLTLRFGTDKPERIAFTEDISHDGLFIKTANVLPPNTRLNILLVLSDNTEVRLNGIVAWAKRVPPQMIRVANKGGMGVRITRILDGEEEYLKLCGHATSPELYGNAK